MLNVGMSGLNQSVYVVIVLLLMMFFMPELALAGRVEDIASSLSGGGSEKVQQLTLFGIYGGMFILLLALLNLAQQKKGAKRLIALVSLLLLGSSFLVLHFT
jgi:hypothetical protein